MKQDINFLYEIGSFRNMQRGWLQHLGMDCADVMDHTLRVVWLSLIIARMERGVDENKIIKMALVHDLSETRTSDLGYVQKAYVKTDDDLVVKEMMQETTLGDFYSGPFKEYEERDSLEAKIVKDADNLDVDLELEELEERGSKLPEKWQAFRKMVRDEKLYTESAKKLWDEIQEVDVADWHLKANKWIKIPESGY